MICFSVGWIDEVASYVREVLVLICRLGVWGSEVYVFCFVGDVVSIGGAEDAFGSYFEVLVLAVELGMRLFVVHCYFGFGKFFRRMGKGWEVQKYFVIVTVMYREMDMWFWLE